EVSCVVGYVGWSEGPGRTRRLSITVGQSALTGHAIREVVRHQSLLTASITRPWWIGSRETSTRPLSIFSRPRSNGLGARALPSRSLPRLRHIWYWMN